MNIYEKDMLVQSLEQKLRHFKHCSKRVHLQTANVKKGHQHAEDGSEYEEKLSSSTFNIEEVESLTFGPISSRFWLYRKHVNTVKTEKMPFLSWEVLTINLKERDVHLVIEDQDEMDRLVKYLLYRLNSIDGIKNSA